MRRVRWEIDVDARTSREAARKVLAIQRDPGSMATVFDVTSKNGTVRVDLSEDTVCPVPSNRKRKEQR
jgi:hypothetical protein